MPSPPPPVDGAGVPGAEVPGLLPALPVVPVLPPVLPVLPWVPPPGVPPVWPATARRVFSGTGCLWPQLRPPSAHAPCCACSIPSLHAHGSCKKTKETSQQELAADASRVLHVGAAASEGFLRDGRSVPGQLKPPTLLPLPLQLPFSLPLFTLPSRLPLELPALMLPVREHTTGQAWARARRGGDLLQVLLTCLNSMQSGLTSTRDAKQLRAASMES